jgi:hypothetical protein
VEREYPTATATQKKLLAKMHARFRVRDEESKESEGDGEMRGHSHSQSPQRQDYESLRVGG